MNFKSVKSLAYLTQVAFIMLTPIIGGIYFGNFLDEKLGSSPWILLLAIIMGVGTAFLSLYKFVMTVTKNHDQKIEDYIPNSKKEEDDEWKQ